MKLPNQFYCMTQQHLQYLGIETSDLGVKDNLLFEVRHRNFIIKPLTHPQPLDQHFIYLCVLYVTTLLQNTVLKSNIYILFHSISKKIQKCISIPVAFYIS